MLTLAHPGTPRLSLTSENHTDPSPVYLSRCTCLGEPVTDSTAEESPWLV